MATHRGTGLSAGLLVGPGAGGKRWTEKAKFWPFKTQPAAQLSTGSAAKAPPPRPPLSAAQPELVVMGINRDCATQRPAFQPLPSSSQAERPVSLDLT